MINNISKIEIFILLYSGFILFSLITLRLKEFLAQYKPQLRFRDKIRVLSLYSLLILMVIIRFITRGSINYVNILKNKLNPLKSKVKSAVSNFKNKRFSFYILFLFCTLLFISPFVRLPINYQLGLLLLYIVALLFIYFIRHIKEKPNKSHITEFEFLKYMVWFCFIVISYIIICSIFYVPVMSFSSGYFLRDNTFYFPTTSDVIIHSGYTFFSMDSNLQPQGLLNLFTLLEVAIAQIILITFIGVMASELIKKLKLIPRKENE